MNNPILLLCLQSGLWFFALEFRSCLPLSAPQLSPQVHYDFGLRAAKAALLRAGELRRSDKIKSEEAALAQAIRLGTRD